MTVELHYDHGTLVVPILVPGAEVMSHLLTPDPRTGTHRAPGWRYRDLVLGWKRAGVPFVDKARRFEPLELEVTSPFEPFPHQSEALERWVAGGSRGVVELPTGAGKTLLAVMAIAKTRRPALVVVPTIDLMVQWQSVLAERFGMEVGTIGGGTSERRAVTVITYDSAVNQIEFLGDAFGLLVVDECHHLPAPAYRFIAEAAIAPFRLGLSATVARADGGERAIFDLLGPLVHQVGIEELEGEYLAPYEVRSVPVRLTEEEQARYDEARSRYLTFYRASGVSFSAQGGFGRFIALAHQSEEGRLAYRAFREQRRIALTSSGKLEALWKVLLEHRGERILVFTEDTETVYRLSRQFFIPAITHQTRPEERKALLAGFAAGEIEVLLAAKVLNEGVDVPEARIGVVLSGSGSVREHVQRLGRILRKAPGKRAILYEIYTEVAAEMGISERRRQHGAYQKAVGPGADGSALGEGLEAEAPAPVGGEDEA